MVTFGLSEPGKQHTGGSQHALGKGAQLTVQQHQLTHVLRQALRLVVIACCLPNHLCVIQAGQLLTYALFHGQLGARKYNANWMIKKEKKKNLLFFSMMQQNIMTVVTR